MVLTPGTRVGPYEITAQIGVGGMGEVYRATDTNLKRAVAIKVLPESVAADAERLARFQREAEVLASLNHPHIAAIYGLERSLGITALVMELVEGPTLADRIALGPIPVDEALPIARQIAEALEAAHGQATIHRDLKPANVKVRPDGTVKVLDFGLAKALEPLDTTAPSASRSPTITTPAMTRAGMILGTAAYMSPEQARGKSLDKRTDIWSFGCVLFEMLTGTRAFAGEDVSDTLAAVLRGEPEWNALPPDVPAVMRTLICRCLEKDRHQRIADMSVVLFVLNEPTILAPTGVGKSSREATLPKPTIWQRMALPFVAVLAAAIVAGVAAWFATRTSIAQPRVSRLQITPPSSAAVTGTAGATRDIAITPDGSRVVYIGANGNLFVRALDQLDPIPLTGLGAPSDPFVSPDGQWIGFGDSNATRLRKVKISGGPAVTLAQFDAGLRGATWDRDDSIVFATNNRATGLQRITPAGEVTVLTRPDPARGEADHLWPKLLPGGQAILFTITATTGLDQAQIAVLDLRTGTQRTLIPGTDAHYVPSGYLVYGAAGTLRAVAFDLARLAVVGTAVPVVEQVVTTSAGGVDIAVGGDGTLVYIPGVGRNDVARTLAWVNRQAQETPILAEPHAYEHPRISPDGARVALHALDEESDIWLWDFVRLTLTRLTVEPGADVYPVWANDSRRLYWSGRGSLYTQLADRTGFAMPLLETSGLPPQSTSVSPDGDRLVFHQSNPKTNFDVMQVLLDGSAQVTQLVRTRFNERNADVSPDGRWLAYEADDSGQFEIYVTPFPHSGGGTQVSTRGGRQPLWARGQTGPQELFYLEGADSLMRVGMMPGAGSVAPRPEKLFDIARYYTGSTVAAYGRMYDVAPDGRFLMIKPGIGSGTPSQSPTSLVVVQHFDEELKWQVPLSK